MSSGTQKGAKAIQPGPTMIRPFIILRATIQSYQIKLPSQAFLDSD